MGRPISRHPFTFLKAILFFLIFFFLVVQIPDDPDLGVHLGVGRYIIEHASVPRTNLFSFALQGHPYVYHSWLSQLIITHVYDGGVLHALGTPLLRLSIVWTFLIAFGIWVLYRLCKQSFWLTLIMLLSSALIFSSIGVRPQVFSFLGAILLLYSLIGWRTHGYRYKYLCALPLIFLFWANMHPGFLIGLVIMGVFVGAEVVSHLRRLGDLGDLRKILVIFFTSIAVTFLNPYGVGLYQQIYAISTNPFNTQVNLEWVPLVARGSTHSVFAILCFIFLVVLMVQKKKDWALLICACFLYLFMLRSTRTAMLFMVVFLPLVSALLARLRGPFVAQKNDWVSIIPLYLACAALGLGIFSRILTNSERAVAALTNDSVLAQRNGYPYGALALLDKLPRSARVFNYFNWGGYLVWQRPMIQVFETGIDDTAIVDRHLFLVDYFTILNGMPGWDHLIDVYAIDTVLVPPAADLVHKLKDDTNWDVLYEDTQSVLISKASPVLQ